jgi:hypothetical protein
MYLMNIKSCYLRFVTLSPTNQNEEFTKCIIQSNLSKPLWLHSKEQMISVKNSDCFNLRLFLYQ